jgi:thiol-disulfide isomerase/thioredoxin
MSVPQIHPGCPQSVVRALSGLLCIVALALEVPPIRAETWRTTNGQSIEGKLSGVFGAIAFISSKADTVMISVNQLDDAALARVAGFLEAPAKAPSAWASSTGKVATSLRGRLQIMREGRMVEFDPGTQPEPELYLVYFGAQWCPPCRQFSPKLVEAYQRLKALAPGRFELVFASSDNSHSEQVSYVREVGMPWPVLEYSARGSVNAIERWEGPGIPDLLVLTRDGEPILNSYHGKEYVGPQSVLDDLEPLLRAMDKNSLSCRLTLHRLSVVQYVRAAAGGKRGPKPYLMGLDPTHYQTLRVKELTALLDVDESGHVRVAKIEPELPAAVEFQLEQDIEKWLFLPAVVDGRPKAVRIKLPINF